jgi:transcriptional regulator with XRE-family HTH domain
MFQAIRHFAAIITRVVFLYIACILSSMEWYDKAKRLMADKKIRQEDLLGIFGVTTRGAVGHYLTGRRQPNPSQMKALADKLGCGLDELLSDREPDPLQLQINKIIRAAEKAMTTATNNLTDEERLSVYRAAFAAGLDMNVTEKQLTAYLSSFVKK